MDLKVFLTVCLTVFVAELGDKTQFATMAFAAKGDAGPWLIFAASSLGLIAAAGIGVVMGQWLSTLISAKTLSMVAGGVFVLLGVITLFKASQMAA